MSDPETGSADSLLAEFREALDEDSAGKPADDAAKAGTSARAARRDFTQMMRRIPVTLTLEVGSARITLQELARLEPNSVVELDALAGDPLVIKVNGTPIGRAEVVVSGENYGLRVLDLIELDLDSLAT